MHFCRVICALERGRS